MKADRELPAGFINKAFGPFRFVRWTKESLVAALTWGEPRMRGGEFTIWSIGIAGYNIAITKTRTR